MTSYFQISDCQLDELDALVSQELVRLVAFRQWRCEPRAHRGAIAEGS